MTRLFSLAALLTACLWLAGCDTTVQLKGSFPTPLVKKAPLKMAVFYPASLRSFVHQEDMANQGNWTIDMGEQNLELFRGMFNVMFERVVEVPAVAGVDDPARLPAKLVVPQGVDGLIIPSIDKYSFLTPQVSGLGFFSASIHYHVNIYNATGERLLDWAVVGYGKSDASVFSGGAALGEATRLAMRDGGARIAIETFEQPAIKAWLEPQIAAPAGN